MGASSFDGVVRLIYKAVHISSSFVHYILIWLMNLVDKGGSHFEYDCHAHTSAHEKSRGFEH